MITLRIFWKDGKLHLDPGQLSAAARAKKVQCKVHNAYDPGWPRALRDARAHLQAVFRAGLWGQMTSVFMLLLIAAIVWWLPLRFRGYDLGGMALGLLGIALLNLSGVAAGVCHQWRVGRFVRRFLLEPQSVWGLASPLPLSQVGPLEKPEYRRWPLVASLILLVLFVGLIFPYAIPIPGYGVTCTRRGTEGIAASSLHAPVQLRLGDRWEWTPLSVSDTTYGLLYYDPEEEEVLVLEVNYTVYNVQLWPVGTIFERFSSWTAWTANNMATNLSAQLPPGIVPTQAKTMLLRQMTAELEEYGEQVGAMLQGASSDSLECRSTVDVGVRVISVSAYQDFLRRK